MRGEGGSLFHGSFGLHPGQSLGSFTETCKGFRLRSPDGDAVYAWYDDGPVVFRARVSDPILPLLLELETAN